MRKSIKSVMAFVLAASMIASTVAPAATASAASKVNVITKATYNSGSTVKYSYNKKGLITKSVSTSSSKDNDSDTSTTVTTTFKYNKKNKVSTKTEKYVTKTTSYEVDKTTGLKLGAKKGTVTTTYTTVTKFTYDKKGLATQSVATTTTTMSGSTTSTDKSSIINNYDYGASKELADGRILAGYNDINNDGTEREDHKNTDKNAYYYEGAVADTEGVTTHTTTYTDNGNGTYTITTANASNPARYTTENVYKYYTKETVNGVETVVWLTKEEGPWEYTDEDGDKLSGNGTYYKKADGKIYTGYADSIIEKVTIKKDADSTSNSSGSSTEVISDKSVTTTKYTYDKKKRVKKAVSTTVNTNEEKTTSTNSSASASKTGSRKSENTTKSEMLSENTSVSTTTYTYDKKGRATKAVSSNDGKENSKYVYSEMDVSSSSESVTISEDGSTSTNKSSSATECAAGFPTVTTTVVKDGVSTVTTTKNPYKYSHSYEYVGKTSSNKNSSTDDVTFYANGGSKRVSTYSDSYSNSYTDGTSYSSSRTGTKTSYNFDEKGKSNGYIDVYTSTSSSSTTPYEGSNAYFTDGKDSSNDVAATQKIDAAKAVLEASGTPYNKVEGTKTVLAKPSKSTTSYKYDKSGNVKSAKESGTTTEIEDVRNEIYGNSIYEWDATGKLQVKQVAVTHKYTDNDAMENTVKKGTKVLTKKLTTNKGTYDRSSSSGSYLSRVLFTLKAKKSSTAKLVNKQQWIIQNGRLNGEVGLN